MLMNPHCFSRDMLQFIVDSCEQHKRQALLLPQPLGTEIAFTTNIVLYLFLLAQKLFIDLQHLKRKKKKRAA